MKRLENDSILVESENNKTSVPKGSVILTDPVEIEIFNFGKKKFKQLNTDFEQGIVSDAK